MIEEILPYLDLYLMDMKHTNPAKHKEFTGRPNDLMMENARKVALSGKCKLIIRVPVIPTFNATVEEIQGIASFANTLPGVEQLHLLPYHRLGGSKLPARSDRRLRTIKLCCEKQQKQHSRNNKNNIKQR